jgi:3-phosphoshikimate 1-carboxyvinyltransferase
MAEELKKMNVDAEELPDGLIIRGGCEPRLKGGAKYLDGRNDHRIVMALSIAGLGLDKQITIDTAEAMSVTFPNYVELMKNLGARMEITS